MAHAADPKHLKKYGATIKYCKKHSTLMSLQRHPIIVVTGANSGVGFGICQRLLDQLAQSTPPDSLFKLSNDESEPTLPSPLLQTQRLTLVLACRNPERAKRARGLLLAGLEKQVGWLKRSPTYDGHAELFKKSVQIDFIPLDLCSIESVLNFAEEAQKRYPYISHIVLNAGTLNLIGIDYIGAMKHIAENPVMALTNPRFMIQAEGLESFDGLGYVFQSNVFGHYCLVRELQPLLRANPARDSRVQWISSLDSFPHHYDQKDIQLRRHKNVYEASKYQCDLICTKLALDAAAEERKDNEASIQYLLTTPGICTTENTSTVLPFLLVLAKILSFYFARLFGSQDHPIKSYKGASSPVYAVVAPLQVLKANTGIHMKKITSKASFFGRPYIGTVPVVEWEKNAAHASDLVAYCDRLLDTFKRAKSTTTAIPDSDVDFS